MAYRSVLIFESFVSAGTFGIRFRSVLYAEILLEFIFKEQMFVQCRFIHDSIYYMKQCSSSYINIFLSFLKGNFFTFKKVKPGKLKSKYAWNGSDNEIQLWFRLNRLAIFEKLSCWHCIQILLGSENQKCPMKPQLIFLKNLTELNKFISLLL